MKVYNYHPSVKPDSLKHDPDVIYINDFNQESLKKFSRDFNDILAADWGIVPIYIDSYGGEVAALMGMVDVIQSSPVPVATICTSVAMSCGSALLAAGTPGYRFAAPNASIMVHDMGGCNWGKAKDILSDGKNLASLKKRYFEIFDKNCNQQKGATEAKLHELGNVDWFLTPKESKKYGIIDFVKLPRMMMNINFGVSFE